MNLEKKMEVKSPDKILTEGMKDLNIRDNIPHIVIGKRQQPMKKSPYQDWKREKNKQYFQEDPFDKKVNQFRRWALVIAILLIAGYATYRIVKFMFFGG